jgi:hypothetical protein
MKEVEYSADNANDFFLYFANSFVYKPEPNGEGKVLFVANRGDGSNIMLQDKANTRFYEKWDTILHTYMMHPKVLGMVNIEESLMYVTRSPMRNVHKGLRLGENHTTHCHHSELFTSIRVRDPSKDPWGVAQAIYLSNYTPLEQAVQEIQKGKALGRALGRYFGVHVQRNYEEMILVYKTTNIGIVDYDLGIRLYYPYQAYQEVIERTFAVKGVTILK